MNGVIFSKNDKLSEQWVAGYSDGYNNRGKQAGKDVDYENGYRRGFSDGVEDFKIPLGPKQPSIFSND